MKRKYLPAAIAAALMLLVSVTVATTGVDAQRATDQSMVVDGQTSKTPPSTIPGTPTEYTEDYTKEMEDRANRTMIENIAEAAGLTYDEAFKMTVDDGQVQELVEDVLKHDPAFSDFRFVDTKDGRIAEIWTVEGKELATPVPRAAMAREIVFRTSAMSRYHFDQAAATAQLKKADPNVLAVSYSAFDEEVTVYRDASSSRSAADELQKIVADGVTVVDRPVDRTEREAGPSGFLAGGGGLKLYDVSNLNDWCTTGWGASRTYPSGFYQTGYMTAGHCYDNPRLDRVTDVWNVGYSYVLEPSATFFHAVTGVNDRVFVDDWVAIADWWTRVDWAPNTVVDMTSVIWEYWQGGYNCWYGETVRSQRCGQVANIGDRWVGFHLITLASIPFPTGVAQTSCDDGDSGGPGWIVNGNTQYPAGMISAKVNHTNNDINPQTVTACGMTRLHEAMQYLPLVML